MQLFYITYIIASRLQSVDRDQQGNVTEVLQGAQQPNYRHKNPGLGFEGGTHRGEILACCQLLDPTLCMHNLRALATSWVLQAFIEIVASILRGLMDFINDNSFGMVCWNSLLCFTVQADRVDHGLQFLVRGCDAVSFEHSGDVLLRHEAIAGVLLEEFLDCILLAFVQFVQGLQYTKQVFRSLPGLSCVHSQVSSLETSRFELCEGDCTKKQQATPSFCTLQSAKQHSFIEEAGIHKKNTKIYFWENSCLGILFWCKKSIESSNMYWLANCKPLASQAKTFLTLKIYCISPSSSMTSGNAKKIFFSDLFSYSRIQVYTQYWEIFSVFVLFWTSFPFSFGKR